MSSSAISSTAYRTLPLVHISSNGSVPSINWKNNNNHPVLLKSTVVKLLTNEKVEQLTIPSKNSALTSNTFIPSNPNLHLYSNPSTFRNNEDLPQYNQIHPEVSYNWLELVSFWFAEKNPCSIQKAECSGQREWRLVSEWDTHPHRMNHFLAVQ